MFDQIPATQILFLDIETVPQYEKHEQMPEPFASLWEKKSSFLIKDEETAQTLYKRAGIYAEFGKIICISCGVFTKDETFRIKSFYSHDEKEVLSDFADLLNKSYESGDKYLCAHNGKEFDFPFICRRLLINGMKLPSILDLRGKKPWEVMHLDTMELWKFGDYKSYTSLTLLAAVFDIPTPKDDIDGSMVGDVYWKEHNLNRIVTYCQKDVLAIAQLYRKFKCEELLTADDLIYAEPESALPFTSKG